MLDPTMAAAVIVMSEGRLYTNTVSITVNFLAPAKPGPIIAEAKVTQPGKTIAFVEGKLLAQDGTLLATATASAACSRQQGRVGLERAKFRIRCKSLLGACMSAPGQTKTSGRI
jgi:acyl-coenzyme A thioesterase PaaI-like protein